MFASDVALLDKVSLAKGGLMKKFLIVQVFVVIRHQNQEKVYCMLLVS